MSEARLDPPTFGAFSDASTLTIQRRLPGPIERVWAYLTDGELRSQWLAAGEMQARSGSAFELVWRNDTLSRSPEERPAGFPEISRATCQLIEFEPPRRLRFAWPDVGEVTMQLDEAGEDVLLTLTHRGIADRPLKVMVAAGWHVHLDILVARVGGVVAPSFWSTWQARQRDYEQRVAS